MHEQGKTWDDVAAHIGMPTRDVHRWRKVFGSPGDSKDLDAWAAFAATRKKKDVTIAAQSVSPAYTSDGTLLMRNPMDVLERIRTAEARIKEARARKDEIANAKQAGELIDAALASQWSARLIASALIEAEGLPAHVDLLGLPPDVAAPLRAAAQDLARRFRNRIAALPDFTEPPKPGVA